MLSYVWPIALVVFSNVMYQICTKTVPNDIHPLASLTVTYLISTAASAGCYFLLNPGGSLIREYSRLNWTPFVFGIVLVALESGWIYIHRAGWQISTAATVQSSFLAVALLFVGRLFFHEALTINKIIGVMICLIGLAIINWK